MSENLDQKLKMLAVIYMVRQLEALGFKVIPPKDDDGPKGGDET
jgi:hypothetical protein